MRFLGGHGTNAADGSRINPYNNTHTADPDLHRLWDSQYPSLWVDKGGGTFANIWTPDTYSQAGFVVSNTSIPGFVYELSSEHHVRAEVKLKNVSNWNLYALQTEEESGESGNASSLEIDGSHDLTIANYHGYRVTHMEMPFPYAVRIADSTHIHFRNVHVDANSSIGLCDSSGKCRQAVRSNKVPFEDAIVDQTLHQSVRDREFAWLDLSDDKPPRIAAHRSTLTLEGAKPQRLATGFFNISGAAVDATGQLYFVDSHFQRIYRWDPKSHNAVVVRDASLDPVNLVFDKSGDLIVLSSGGRELTAYSFRPENPEAELSILKPIPATENLSLTAALPVDYWFNGDFSNTLSATRPYTYTTLQQMFEANLSSRKQLQFISPDHTLFIPTDPPIVQGEPYFGTKWAPVLEAYGLVKAVPGKPFYATNEAEQRTYRGVIASDGSLMKITPFVEQGGEPGSRCRGQRLSYSWTDLHLLSCGQITRHDRRAREAARHYFRWCRSTHPVSPYKPFTLLRASHSSGAIERRIALLSHNLHPTSLYGAHPILHRRTSRPSSLGAMALAYRHRPRHHLGARRA